MNNTLFDMPKVQKKVKRTYTHYSSPSHGWIKVPTEDVVELGAHHFLSAFSYQSKDGKSVWIEEDSDAVRFLEVAKIREWNVTIKDRYIEDDSKIRDCPSFDINYVVDFFIPWWERRKALLAIA